MAAMEGLGRLFDLSAGAAVQDMHTAAITGKRVSMKGASGIAVIVQKGAGTASQDPVLTFLQATAASGGSTSAWGAVIDHYYKKSGATTLSGAETWSRVSQTAASTVTLTGESTNQGIYVIELRPEDATVGSDAFLEVDLGSLANSQLVAVTFALHDLEVQRKPANLANSQT